MNLGQESLISCIGVLFFFFFPFSFSFWNVRLSLESNKVQTQDEAQKKTTEQNKTIQTALEDVQLLNIINPAAEVSFVIDIIL